MEFSGQNSNGVGIIEWSLLLLSMVDDARFGEERELKVGGELRMESGWKGNRELCTSLANTMDG